MGSIIEKIFTFFKGNGAGSSELMERATELSMIDEDTLDVQMDRNLFDFLMNSPADPISQHAHLHEMDDLMHQQLHETDDLMHQQFIDQMHDPYLNPGQDIVIDETYHGIDHGSHDHF